MDTELIGSTIIPIDKNGKYIIKIPEKITNETRRKIMDLLDDWLAGEQPFAVITGEWEIIEIKGNDGRH